LKAEQGTAKGLGRKCVVNKLNFQCGCCQLLIENRQLRNPQKKRTSVEKRESTSEREKKRRTKKKRGRIRGALLS